MWLFTRFVLKFILKGNFYWLVFFFFFVPFNNFIFILRQNLLLLCILKISLYHILKNKIFSNCRFNKLLSLFFLNYSNHIYFFKYWHFCSKFFYMYWNNKLYDRKLNGFLDTTYIKFNVALYKMIFYVVLIITYT